MPDNDPGNGNGRFRWTDVLRDDLLDAYEHSEHGRRGYMARMHALWCDKHPELNHISKQHLRDHVAYLRRSGYVRTPQNEPEVPAAPVQDQVQPVQETAHIQQINPENTNNGLSLRKTRINMKYNIKPQDMTNMDAVLAGELPEITDIVTLNNAVYRAASQLVATVKGNGFAERILKTQRRIDRITNKILIARQQASRIQCVVEYITAKRAFTENIRKMRRRLRQEHHTLNKGTLLTIKQRCLDRIRSLGVIKKSLIKKSRGIKDNNTFHTKPSRLLDDPQPVIENPPSATEVENFWKDIYENATPIKENTSSLIRFRSYCTQFQQYHRGNNPQVTQEEVRKALEGTRNFSAPGLDGINNFWWKKFPSTHRHLARIFNSWLNANEPIPEWLVEGRTTLIPKKGNLAEPKNYRPITCLNSCYKIFTRILYYRLLSSVEPVLNDVVEQRGGRKGFQGCKENLLIDRCITQDSIQYKRNLSMAWIDYKKAFDTTSHELLLHLLRILSVPMPLVRCIKQLMPLWKSKFSITAGNSKVITEPVTFKRGVFQGDSLSPLLFCISLLPISVALRQTRGYQCGTPGNRTHKVTHLFYMDDLKIYAMSDRDLQQSLKVVQEYTRDIGMEFGLDKCAVLRLQKGRSVGQPENEQLTDGSILRHLEDDETYRYLGVDQHRMHDTNNVKKMLRSKYRQRLRKVWESQLSGINKVAATNMLAVPVLLYSFGVLKWRREELRELDVSTRKMMHMNRSIHPRSSVSRIYLPRHQGGRGLLSLERLHDRLTVSLACKVANSADPLLQLVRDHETTGIGAFLFKAAGKAADELGLRFAIDDNQSLTRLEPAQVKRLVRAAEQQLLLEDHVSKPQHGVFYRNIEDLNLSRELTFSFLRSADLKSETEGFLLACQDGVINTLVYRAQFSDVADVRCRTCQQYPETLMHLLSACPVQAVSGYIYRHNAALRVLYYHLRHHYGIDETPVLPYAPDEIQAVVENNSCRIYWNYAFPTTTRLQANKPDLVLLDKQSHSMFVIEFSAPAETNILIKEREKRAKYIPLIGELQRMYPEYSVRIVVLIVGVLGGIKDSMLTELQKIPACRDSSKQLVVKMQKAVVLGSLRLLRQMNLAEDH